jgi:hypothetical protein
MRHLARKFHAELKVGSGSVVGKLDVQARLAKAA